MTVAMKASNTSAATTLVDGLRSSEEVLWFVRWIEVAVWVKLRSERSGRSLNPMELKRGLRFSVAAMLKNRMASLLPTLLSALSESSRKNRLKMLKPYVLFRFSKTM